ncbi:hypothetical protein [Myceligenerans indicum]|uniref:Lipoprotein n=1 Tax=Myceligenerans indicum TaxID=2593663 RepID=A0ABS1LHM6_9MICO|nr:hypothetical protein [Myceligenerans indicum]MBL0885564.1 hypothetical protein [Myceligenerans indicum]
MTPSVRSRRTGLAVLIATVLTLTTACGAFGPRSGVTIEEYEAQTEALAATLAATIDDVPRDPDGPDGPNDIISNQVTLVDAEGGARKEHPWKYCVLDGTFTFAKDSGTSSEQAADSMAEVLRADGWNEDEHTVHESGGGYEFRRPDDDNSTGWYVELSFGRGDRGTRQLTITIASPSTDASDGSAAAAAEFEDAATRLELALDGLDDQVRAARLPAFLAGDKAAYLDGLERWKAAATEVRTVIRLVRASLHSESGVGVGVGVGVAHGSPGGRR